MATLNDFVDTAVHELTPEFENQLWKAADKLRKKVEVHQYKYIVLGLIFLRYLTYAYNERREELSQLLKEEKDLTGKIKEVLDSLGYRLEGL